MSLHPYYIFIYSNLRSFCGGRRPHQSSFHHATVLTIAGDSYRLKAATRHQASRTPQEVPRQ